MNILFFLVPKEEVAYVKSNDTLRQAMEKMECHRFSCVPIIDREGVYQGCITEGDLLWGLKELNFSSIKETEKVSITKIKRKYDYKPVHIETDMEQLIHRASNQNFVPVIDDQDKFIGIIKRRDILNYCYQNAQSSLEKADS